MRREGVGRGREGGEGRMEERRGGKVGGEGEEREGEGEKGRLMMEGVGRREGVGE